MNKVIDLTYYKFEKLNQRLKASETRLKEVIDELAFYQEQQANLNSHLACCPRLLDLLEDMQSKPNLKDLEKCIDN